MQTFTSEDLQRHASDVQQVAMQEPAFISVEGRTQLVIMSLAEFNRLRGQNCLLLKGARFSDDITEELQRLADENPDDGSDFKLLGGVLDNGADGGSLTR